MTQTKWQRMEEGYEAPAIRARIFDNGAGVGPSAGSGRWAVEIDGTWVANVDTLDAAKDLAVEQMTPTCFCGEPEDGGEFGWFTQEAGETVCNACGSVVPV